MPTATTCADGEPGELYSCNSYTFDGYWKLPEKTSEAFRGDYCTVGDLARRDEDGYIVLVDRKSNMIISGGENVYPSEVESLVGGHPKVKDVAVIGIGDENGANAFTPSIIARDGETPTQRRDPQMVQRPHCRLQAAEIDFVHTRGGNAKDRHRKDPASRAANETYTSTGVSS